MEGCPGEIVFSMPKGKECRKARWTGNLLQATQFVSPVGSWKFEVTYGTWVTTSTGHCCSSSEPTGALPRDQTISPPSTTESWTWATHGPLERTAFQCFLSIHLTEGYLFAHYSVFRPNVNSSRDLTAWHLTQCHARSKRSIHVEWIKQKGGGKPHQFAGSVTCPINAFEWILQDLWKRNGTPSGSRRNDTD